MDVLSEVLRSLRLDAALFLNCEFKSPWCVQSSPADALAKHLKKPGSNVVLYHLIAKGSCTARLKDGREVALNEGDIVIFPRADVHLIGSHIERRPMPMDTVLEKILNPDMRQGLMGGDGESTVILCGWLATERTMFNPLVSALPELLSVNILNTPSGEWLRASLDLALRSCVSDNVTATIATQKIAEALFTETLHQYVDGLPDSERNWLSALRDPAMGRALNLLHQAPERDWTVDSLAREAGLSRTGLADRFQKYLGAPPMHYLTQWRMALAAGMLRAGVLNIGHIIEKIGYESESAFSRTFKRAYGHPPARWARLQLDG